MKKRTIIWAVVIVVLAVSGWFLFRGTGGQEVSKLDAIDTVGDFYGQWLKAAQEPAVAQPDRMTLAKSPILSKVLRERLVSVLKQSDVALDPVLCQTVVPEGISLRSVYERTDEAQVLVTSQDKKVTEQAIITLIRHNDGWYLGDIECSPGEFAAEREFSFEREGHLLKGSIPPPFDSENWHLVFEEDGVPGHVVPLFFNSESQCTSLEGAKSVCIPSQFKEGTKAFVHGQMSERGVNVNRQEFVE